MEVSCEHLGSLLCLYYTFIHLQTFVGFTAMSARMKILKYRGRLLVSFFITL